MPSRLGIQGELKALYPSAGTLDLQRAANAWAGTTNLDLLAALNAKAGTVGKEMAHVCRLLGLPEGP